VTRAAVIRDPATPQGIGQFSAIQSLAPSLSLEVTPLNARDAGDIERAIAAVDRNPNSGLIVTGSNLALIHRELIVTLAARYKLPAVYPLGFFAVAGGLISYGPMESSRTGAPPATWIASSKARSRLIFLCRRRPSTS
jgi:putative ABC transport system substrate-binding protein